MRNGPVLYYDAGSVAVLTLNSLPQDNLTEPKIEAIFNPFLKRIQGFPAPMYPLSEEFPGIYLAKFQLPQGKITNDTYLCIIGWKENGVYHRALHTIIVGQKTALRTSMAVGI